MKQLAFTIFISIFYLILSNGNSYSANEQFRSVTSGDWNSTSTWEMSLNGSTWFAATSTPSDTSGAITVRSPNTVSVSADISADQLVVDNGGTISVNNLITLTILDGSGTDLTLNSGGTISGPGTLQTQGNGTLMNIHIGSAFNVSLKVNSGTTSAYDSGGPFTAFFNGAITVDAGAMFAVNNGGYTIQANNNITNNGKITGPGGTFKMRGAVLTNNDTVNVSTLSFDSTTALAGTGAYTDGIIIISSSGNVSLSNNLTFSPTSTFTVNGGGVLNPNSKILTFNSGTFICDNGSTISNSGTFQTQGTVTHNIHIGSNFNTPLKINTGNLTSYDSGGPFTAIYKGTVTVDAGATFTVNAGGYTIQANSGVTNNGTISGVSSGTFRMRGATLSNTGSILVTNFSFDSTTSVTGAGSYSANVITIAGSGKVTLGGGITFSPTSNFTINSGGVLTPSGETFTFTSGTFILNSGATVSGSGASAGTMRTQNNVNFIFRTGAIFNSKLRVLSGTLTAYNDGSPFNAVYSGTITVDAGATLTVLGGGYTSQANGNITNNGTITSGSASTYIIRSATLVNNGVINPTNLNFDSTTSISGTGTFTSSSIIINGSGNVSLANNIAFSPSQNFVINNGGILNPNTRTFTFNSGTCTVNSGGTVPNSGTFQTQNAVTLLPRLGSNFNCPLKVNTGTVNVYDPGGPFTAFFNGTITVDAGAALSVQAGGYLARSNGNVTNNGTITSGPGSFFIMRGSSLTNAGSINPTTLNFDSTTSISGAGTFTGTNININGSGNVSLANNLTFSPTSTFDILNGGVLNPNSFIFTLSSGTFHANNGSTISISGTFQTQGTVNLIIRNGSNFNAPLKVNTGTATSFDDGGPFTAVYNGTITVDAGATLTIAAGGYVIRANNNVTNNGTLASGSSSIFRFFGTTFSNNGSVTTAIFNFESGAHTLQGTGSWTTNANVLNGSTVTLASNHQMQSVSISSGGTFDVLTFKLSLTASNPIGNNGTFNTPNGTVEYNGTSAQSISTANITYKRLRINNAAGTSLIGDVTVTGLLTDLLGHLNLNGHILTLSTAGSLSETPGNTINGTSGYITTTRTLNAPTALDVAGMGAVLTTSVNLRKH